MNGVAFGTSAPELVVSVDAALSGANDIAIGNVAMLELYCASRTRSVCGARSDGDDGSRR